MLSSVTLYCQVTKIVMDSGSQFSELLSVSQMSQVTRFVFVIVFVFVSVIVFLLVRSCPLITLVKCLKGHKSLGSLFVFLLLQKLAGDK